MSTEELSLGDIRDTLEEAVYALHEYKTHPYGPAVTQEMIPSAADALTRLCGGVDQARGVYAAIVSDLGGYMPRGVVLALLRVAQANGQEDR